MFKMMINKGATTRILITGGYGFLGSNLAAYGINNVFRITIFDNLSLYGFSQNLEWLKYNFPNQLDYIHF